jgi:hypothetical protein
VDVEEDYQHLYRLLTNQPLVMKPGLGTIQKLPTREIILPPLPPREREQLFQPIIPNFFAYDEVWSGRDKVIRDLNNRIRQNCRLVILFGITGIGKTALGERLPIELADWFNDDWSRFQQENFENEEQSSDFASVAARWMEEWGEVITPTDRTNPQRLLNRLVKHLQERCYLIQMDSIENILEGNENEGWNNFKDEWWVKFFESYLNIRSCQSCIILTTQDWLGLLEEIGSRSQNFWHRELLSGLQEPEQLILFEKTGLDVHPLSTGTLYLQRIGKAYEGYPLALRVIAGEIKNKPFEGNVVAYWNEYGSEVEEVERAIAEAQEGRSTGAMDQWKLGAFGDSYTPGEPSIIGKNSLPPIGKGSPWDKLRLSR